jgi:hypothetical protein
MMIYIQKKLDAQYVNRDRMVSGKSLVSVSMIRIPRLLWVTLSTGTFTKALVLESTTFKKLLSPLS